MAIQCCKCGNIAYPALRHLHGLNTPLCYRCTTLLLRKAKDRIVVCADEVKTAIGAKGKRKKAV